MITSAIDVNVNTLINDNEKYLCTFDTYYQITDCAPDLYHLIKIDEDQLLQKSFLSLITCENIINLLTNGYEDCHQTQVANIMDGYCNTRKVKIVSDTTNKSTQYVVYLLN